MKDNAVSSVVGVILALSITITVACVLVAFAGGSVSAKEPTPSVDFDVSSFGSGDDFRLLFEHKGGDKLIPSDIKVTVLVKSSDGKDIVNSFMLSELPDMTDTDVWSAGKIISTENTETTAKHLSMTSEGLKKAIDISTPVRISIYHVPSSVMIYKSDIILEKT